MYSRPNVATPISLVALLMVLSVGAALSLAGPSNAQDEGGTPTSTGIKCVACKTVGCPDTSAQACSTFSVEVTAELAAEILKLGGTSVAVGGSITWTCYQGVTYCNSDALGPN